MVKAKGETVTYDADANIVDDTAGRCSLDGVVIRPEPARRCSESRDIPWPGHRASLGRKHCKNKTRHPSGKCWQHRPYNVAHQQPRELEKGNL